MSKTKVIFFTAILCLASMSAFAGSFIIGAGANLNMYHTESNWTVDALPTTMYGYGVSTETSWLGGLVPDKTYLIFQHSVGEFNDTLDANVYSVETMGVWNLSDTTKKLNSFLLMRTGGEVEKSNNSSTTYWKGQLGIGLTYPISKKADVWGALGARFGTSIDSDIAVGLKFEI